MGESWSVVPQSWDELQNKPAALADNIIDWSEITSKPSTFTPSTHSHNYAATIHDHDWADLISGIPATASRWPSWNEVTSKPSTFTPSTHSHTLSALTDTTFTSLATNQLMRFDGTKWINFTPDYATVNHNHNSLYLGINAKAVDAEKLDGFEASVSNLSGTIAIRNGSGDILCRLIRQEYAVDTGTDIRNIVTTRAPGINTDNYLRYCTLSNFRGAVTDPFYFPLSAIESGSFSPVLRTVQSSTGANFSARNGAYYKIGNLVYFVAIFLSSTLLPSSTEQVAMSLPFPARNDFNSGIVVLEMTGFTLTSNQRIIASVVNTLARFWISSNTMSLGSLPASSMSGNTIIRINGVYSI